MTADGLAFKAWVRAVPAEGQANDALMRLVCETLGVTKARVALVSGHKSRVKSLSVAGDMADLETRLEAIWALSHTAIKLNT